LLDSLLQELFRNVVVSSGCATFAAFHSLEKAHGYL